MEKTEKINKRRDIKRLSWCSMASGCNAMAMGSISIRWMELFIFSCFGNVLSSTTLHTVLYHIKPKLSIFSSKFRVTLCVKCGI